MKFKRVVAAVAAVAATAAMLTLAACDGGDADGEYQPSGITAEHYVYVNANEYGGHDYIFTVSDGIVELDDQTTLYDYMAALKENGALNFEASEDSYGMYINGVGGVEEKYDGTNAMYFWSIYTDLTELDGVLYTSDYSSYTYDGVTMFPANYGASGLPAVEGYTYALVYTYSTW